MRRLALAFTALLTGCGGLEPDPALRTRIEAQLNLKLAPVRPVVIAMWHAGDEPSALVCGEIEAPPLLRSQQSTARFITVPGDIYLEPHLIATNSVGTQIAAESTAIFGTTWSRHCLPNAPLGRRLAGWFSSPRATDDADTPLTNAHVHDLIRKAPR